MPVMAQTTPLDPLVATADIQDGAVTNAKLADMAVDTVKGRVTAGTGDPEDVATTGSGNVVRATSPTLVTPALGTPASGVLTNMTGLPTAGMVDAAVTLAKMANLATARVVGRTTAGTGVPEAVVVGTAAGQVAPGDHITPAMTATVAGHVPTPPNVATQYLDGTGSFSTPASGVALAGSDLTERTTTSLTAVNLSTVSGLAIPVATSFMIQGVWRKSAGAAASVSLGLTLNATAVLTPIAVSSIGNAARQGAFRIWVFSRNGALQLRGMIFEAIEGESGTSTIRGASDADLPTGNITDVIIRGLSGDALVTVATDELRVYTLPV